MRGVIAVAVGGLCFYAGWDKAEPRAETAPVAAGKQVVATKYRSYGTRRGLVAPYDSERSQWGEALAKIRAEVDPELRASGLKALTAGDADPRGAISWMLAEEADETAKEAGLGLLRQWAEKDPATAAAWLKESTMAKNLREEAVKQVALAWTGTSVAEAIRWAEGLPENERNRAVLQIADESTRTTPVEALRLAAKLPSGAERDGLIEHAAAEWTTKAPAEAAAWAKGMVEGEVKDRTMVAVISAWGDTDPAAAAEMAISSLPAGRPLDDALVGIVQRWAQKEPENALAWVNRFPEGALREVALENISRLRPETAVSAEP
ncbi:MAG: hypothetical protein K0Q55_567 [Verrucomicrobia bacterium]|nr:hypothetical protein [Verrucomicrobiota bacterium]